MSGTTSNTATWAPSHVHLVGSIGLDTVKEVFSMTGKTLGRRLKRVPDGEIGGRRMWAGWQYTVLRGSPYLRYDPSGAIRRNSRLPQLCLAEGIAPSELSFPELGYALEARGSYQGFLEARARGEISADCRFQVCLPTPAAVVYSFCTPRDLVAILDAYEKAMQREIDLLVEGIPHKDLTVQIDICQEMILTDGQPQDEFPEIGSSLAELVERTRRLAERVPADVELGFHLCYGDFGAKHFIEPIDATALVNMANALTVAIKRRIDYIHMPVPLTRDDDGYFAPLTKLKLRPETELYLGIVHPQDGVEGGRRRIATAHKYVPDFGIATECGMSRARTPELVQALIKLQADLAAPAR